MVHIGGRNPDSKLVVFMAVIWAWCRTSPADAKRQEIPWVSYRNADGTVTVLRISTKSKK